MSRIRANQITNENSNGAPNFPSGITHTGILTATALANPSGDLTITGNLSSGGVLTYEDSANEDSIGIVTARSGVKIGPIAGVLHWLGAASSAAQLLARRPRTARLLTVKAMTLGICSTPFSRCSVSTRARRAIVLRVRSLPSRMTTANPSRR